MSVSYEYYKIFYYVAKYRSFNKAAAVLSNSQPNISSHVNIPQRISGNQIQDRCDRENAEALYSRGSG